MAAAGAVVVYLQHDWVRQEYVHKFQAAWFLEQCLESNLPDGKKLPYERFNREKISPWPWDWFMGYSDPFVSEGSKPKPQEATEAWLACTSPKEQKSEQPKE